MNEPKQLILILVASAVAVMLVTVLVILEICWQTVAQGQAARRCAGTSGHVTPINWSRQRGSFTLAR